MKYLMSLFLLLVICANANAQAIKIWNGTTVHSTSVKLTPYLPVNKEISLKTAIIICPGGSYFWLSIKDEGQKVAEWLKDNGYAAFLLEYRTGGWFDFSFRTRVLFGGHQFPDMFEDVQRSIQIIRENADTFNVNPRRVGVMGFSAGGHLALSSAIFCNTDYLLSKGISISSDISLCPDFVAAIYPVVTMSNETYVHKKSRRGLLGERNVANIQLRDSLSLEKHIRKDLPPIFLLNCEDDKTVDFHNSVLLDSALSINNVNHTYIKCHHGGHGFGANLSKMSDETSCWQTLFLDWLQKLHVND